MARETEPALPTLLTFAPMVDSELSRLLLAHYGVTYRERDHLLIKASLLTLMHGGHVRIPLLYGGGVRLTSPRRIAGHYDPLALADRRLVPAGSEAAKQIEDDWRTYNKGLALAAARFAYFHLLPLRELMSTVFAAPLPVDEAAGSRKAYPLQAAVLRLLLRIGAEQAQTALADIRNIFAQTDARIADGRLYLCGDRLTLGDLALASAAAPLLLPPGYGTKMPGVALMPVPLRNVVHELRGHPTAVFVQRLYAERFAAAQRSPQ
jgi:glutathione S-transferase